MAGVRYRSFSPSYTGVVPSVDMSTDNHRPNGRIPVESYPFSEGGSPDSASGGNAAPEPLSEDLINDPRGVRCSEHWAAQLRRQGIVDMDAEDLRQEAWIRSRRALATGDVENQAAFLCEVIKNLALMRMRRHRIRRDETADPTTGPIALHAPADPRMVEVTVRLHLDEVLLFLDRHRDEIWASATEAFGGSKRADSIWAAARLATLHLVVQDNNWSIDETLDASMRQSDDWWRSERRDGETSDEAAERGRKRIARDRPWVSYITLLEAMMWLHLDNRAARAELTRHHLRHLQIHLREAEARRQVTRVAALRKHIAAVESNVA